MSSLALEDTRRIEAVLWQPAAALTDILVELLEDRGRAECALATLNDESFARVVSHLNNGFPKTAKEFCGSMWSSMLSKFVATLVEMAVTTDLGTGGSKKSLDARRNGVVLAGSALAEIARLSSKTGWSQGDIAVKVFADLNLKTPSTVQELAMKEREILQEQLRMLKHSLKILRTPASVAALSKRQGISTVNADVFENTISITAPFYSENVKGFGEWKLFITDAANAHLRQLRRRSPDTLLIVLRKMRDLSRGHFSPDNQILISDTEKSVPIFKAKMTGDTRLVYQVDCVTDPESRKECQALRIFGVYNHDELYRMKQFWVSLGRDLGRQGKTYRERCRQRSQGRNTSNDVFSPQVFSCHADDNEPLETLTTWEIPSELDYSEMLTMHRFVGFSKALLNSKWSRCGKIAFMYEPSPEEREIIEHPTSCYVIGRSGTGKTLTMMYKIVAIEHGWASSYTWGLTKPRQLFVTRSRMLAGQVHRTVNEVLESFRLAEMTQAELAELRTRRDQPEELRRPVPKKWSQLDDDHFPLFLSFDQVRAMLEADYAGSTRAPMLTSEDSLDVFDEGSFVSGKRFISTYWSRFPQRLTHGLDPSSVFGEIMGVLQGSEEAHNTARGYLSREAYLGSSERAYSTFATERERIYNIFEAYLKLKRRRQEYDDAERTHNLLVLMVKEKLPGPPVQFLYNDEVQDNLMIDMLFMRSLSNNSNGIFWAGDTAQTITLGSSFKFSELTSLMYRVERREPNRLHIPPHTFNLTVNRRSHMGIINAAQTVVDLLTTLWSESTDKLSRDKGHKRGPKPIFIRGSTELFKLLGHRENLGVSLELGSEQCTIVRDEVSLDALFSRGVLGGVTLTVEQSKGLEFNDVFLWNFFGSSESSMREWAVVGGAPGHSEQYSPQPADKYRNVCRELKCLYVAITRARNHLFIIEETVISHPMLNLWRSKDQLDIASNLESWILPVSKSLPEDWAKRGRILMDKQNYEQAKYCFQRAGLPRETNIAQAYHLRESAVTAEQFVEAAQLFESCAAKTLDVADRKELLLASATCFSRARDNLRSAELYHAALEYTKCIVQYCKATSWQKALDVICQHRDDVELRAMQNVLLHFFDLGQYSRIAEVFADTEELILFMKIHGMKPHLAAYLELLGRYQEAAEIHLGLSHIPQAIALFFRDPDPNSAAQGTTRLLDELWQVSTLGQSVNEVSKTSNVPIQTLVNLAKQRQALFGIQYKNHQIHEDEISMFLLLTSRDATALARMGMHRSSSGDVDEALLLLDYAFKFWHEQKFTLSETSTLLASSFFLPAYYTYTTLLQGLSSDVRVCRILGIRKGPSAKRGSYVLLAGTLLFKSARSMQGLELQVHPGEDALTITASSLSRLLRVTLREHLRSQALVINNMVKKAPILGLCVSYCLAGSCFGFLNNSCNWKHQGGAHLLGMEGMHSRIRTLCQVIIAFGPVNSADDAIWKERAMWMYALTTCLHVPFFALGTSFMFHVNLVPEFTDACRVMYGWITDILYRAYTPNSIHCISSLALRTSAIACAALLGYMLDKLRWGAHSTSPFINIPLDRFHGQSYGRHFQQFHRFLHAAGESAYAQMPGALLYIRFLLEHRDHLLGRQDLLTHIMEGLSTAFILADGRRSNPTVHNVVLSRRWLINLTSLWNVSSRPHPHVDTYPKMFFNLFSAILGGLCKLPTAANRSPTSLSQNIVANVSRAIKSFFLVGQWLQLAQDDDRSRIVGQIGRTSKHFRPHHIQTLFTTGTPDWEDLARAVWQYNVQDRGSAEELVHVQRLEDLPEDRAMETYETIVCVTYTSLTDLPSLLSIQQTHAQPTPFLPQWFLPRARPTAEGPKQVLGLCLRGQQGPLPVL